LSSTLNAAIMLAENINVSVVLVQPVKLNPKLNRYLPDVCAALLPELRKHRHLLYRQMFSMYSERERESERARARSRARERARDGARERERESPV
jgi:hypothetical protein